MHLTDHDLRQLDRDALSQLEEEALRRLAERLLADLKEARDRLNQDSRNRSRPPGSDSVYRQPSGAAERDVPTERAPGDPPTTIADQPREAVEVSDDGAALAKAPPGAATPAARRPGRQPGAPGFGRSQKLTVNAVFDHWPERCAACDEPFAAEPLGQAYGGYDEIEVRLADPNAPGWRLWVTRHRFLEAPCRCSHGSRPCVGPARMARRTGGCSADARAVPGRADRHALPALSARARQGSRAPLCETPWRERGRLLWLWVFNELTAPKQCSNGPRV